MLIMIDNYDSFTYNLVQYFGELGAEVKVFRNDEITIAEIEALKPDHICISPGPCSPKEAGCLTNGLDGLHLLAWGYSNQAFCPKEKGKCFMAMRWEVVGEDFELIRGGEGAG